MAIVFQRVLKDKAGAALLDPTGEPLRGGKWRVKYRDAAGKWVQHVTTAATRDEAMNVAKELEYAAERSRLGLTPRGGEPVAEGPTIPCPGCGEPFVRPRKQGRTRRYCSAACRTRIDAPATLEEALLALAAARKERDEAFDEGAAHVEREVLRRLAEPNALARIAELVRFEPKEQQEAPF